MASEAFVVWGLSALLVAAIVIPYAVSFRRRRRHDRTRKDEAVRLGVDRPKAQFPAVDPMLCIGCGACVAACPEGDVLGVVGGMATVVNGLKCVGHGRCEEACPVAAIAVGLGDLRLRPDIPVLDEWNEAGVPGLFLAGEVAGFALVKNAVSQARRVIERIAERAPERRRHSGGDVFDVAIVGAGPAGLAAAATAQARGLSHVVLEQERSAGGTIFHYPRRKLVLVQPIELPLYGRLGEGEYSKEQLLEILAEVARRARARVRYGERVEEIARVGAVFSVRTTSSTQLARFVVLALGRRGTPRKLGVPGEELPKVMYQLIDAESYRSKRLLVVGGGDSAVEAALGLSLQAGNSVSLSYRREKLVRIKRRNEERIADCFARGSVRPLFGSEVVEILPDRVRLRQQGQLVELPNDFVFVLAGGEPPFDFLRKAGVRFGGDPEPSPPGRAAAGG